MSQDDDNLERLRVTEIFRSLQGEGPSLGLPATFLRLAGCNLACRYCDTPYTWDARRYDLSTQSRWMAISEVLSALTSDAPSRLVITGGEPLLQQPALARLLELLPSGLVVEVETNATLAATQPLLGRVNQWNLSPKLLGAGVRLPTDVGTLLRAYRETPLAFLKFVIAEPSNLAEVDALVASQNWPKSNVVLMPECRSVGELSARSRFVAEAAIERGYRFSTRLQLLLWGDQRGH